MCHCDVWEVTERNLKLSNEMSAISRVLLCNRENHCEDFVPMLNVKSIKGVCNCVKEEGILGVGNCVPGQTTKIMYKCVTAELLVRSL